MLFKIFVKILLILVVSCCFSIGKAQQSSTTEYHISRKWNHSNGYSSEDFIRINGATVLNTGFLTIKTKDILYLFQKDSIKTEECFLDIFKPHAIQTFNYPINYKDGANTYFQFDFLDKPENTKLQTPTNDGSDFYISYIALYDLNLRDVRLHPHGVNKFSLSHINVSSLLVNDTFNLGEIYNCQLDELEFDNCSFQNLNFRKSSVNSLRLKDVTIETNMTFREMGRLGEIELNNVNIKIVGLLDLNEATKKGTECKLKIVNTDVSQLNLNYENFKLSFPTDINEETALNIYKSLLEKQKQFDYENGLKKLDVEYREFKSKHSKLLITKFKNWLEKYWWNYGYDRHLIFTHTLQYLCLLTLVTFFILRYLNDKIYTIENIPFLPKLKNLNKRINPFESKDEKSLIIVKNILTRLWYSLIYTTTIFFRLTIKVEKINFGRIGSLYVLFIYSLGIICLAYIANYMIQN